MEWVFPIEGARAEDDRAIERELLAIEGMLAARIDVQASVVQLTFDADRVCGGEILSVLGDHGCVPRRPPYVGPEPVTARTHPETTDAFADGARSRRVSR